MATVVKPIKFDLEITKIVLVGKSGKSNNSILVTVQNNCDHNITIKGITSNDISVDFNGNRTVLPHSTVQLSLHDVGWKLGYYETIIIFTSDGQRFTSCLRERGEWEVDSDC